VATGVATGVGVGVASGVGVATGVGVGVGAGALHVSSVMTLSSRVTTPFRASTRPSTVEPVFSVIEVRARMLPTNVVSVPSVAELPTWKKMLQARAPLMSSTLLPDAVVSAIWKTKTASGSPCASRVSAPVQLGHESKQ